MSDIQRLHAAAVVDELQQGLSRTLGSKASIGSLTSLVKTMKERRKTEIDILKAKLRIRGHRLFDAMKKFMVMLVVDLRVRRADRQSRWQRYHPRANFEN